MAKIRDDFEGITIVRTGASQDIILRAGDTIPDDVTVGDHLLASGKQKPVEPKVTLTAPPKAGPGSGAGAWRDYATAATEAAGLHVEIPEDATRADIIEALEGADIATE